MTGHRELLEWIDAAAALDFEAFRANGDMLSVPTAPGLGITLDARVENSMTIAAAA